MEKEKKTLSAEDKLLQPIDFLPKPLGDEALLLLPLALPASSLC